MRTSLALLASLSLLAPLARAQSDEPADLNPLNSPRTADPEWRAEFGYPDPRPSDVVLAEIDSLPPYKRDGRVAIDLARQRLNLISELDESGYTGDRLAELLDQQLFLTRVLWYDAYKPMNYITAVFYDVQDRHAGTASATAARLAHLSTTLFVMNHSGMTASESTMEEIARLELELSETRPADEVGHTMNFAISQLDRDRRDHWRRWTIDHLPAESIAVRAAERAMLNGSPIRLQGPTLDGGTVDTQSWLGDVVLVDFWGSWCGPCIALHPTIADLHTRYQAQGLRVLSVLCDDHDQARAYLAEHPAGWPQLIDNRPPDPDNPQRHFLTEKYGITSFPTLWLIDREGVLHFVPDSSPEGLESQVLSLLNPTTAEEGD